MLSLATVATILVDQWLGGPASFTNFFGYSPLLAARFYGMGNEAAAIVFGAAVVGAALLFDQWPESGGVKLGKRVGLPILGLLVVFTAAAPFFGANIGVAIWGIVGFGLAWVLMNGHHVSWKLVFWLFVGVVAVIAAFAAVDLFGGGQQTHLGRALVSAEQGGLGELWAIVARKAETNRAGAHPHELGLHPRGDAGVPRADALATPRRVRRDARREPRTSPTPSRCRWWRVSSPTSPRTRAS